MTTAKALKTLRRRDSSGRWVCLVSMLRLPVKTSRDQTRNPNSRRASRAESGSVAANLLVFVSVVDAGGFGAASRRSGIPVSRQSRQIASLEGRLNVSLIVRSSRGFKVTDIGLRMYEHGVSIRAETQGAVSAMHDSLGRPSGLLRISYPIALSPLLVAPLAIDFSRRCPEVSITLDANDGRPWVLSEPVDLLIWPSTLVCARNERGVVRWRQRHGWGRLQHRQCAEACAVQDLGPCAGILRRERSSGPAFCASAESSGSPFDATHSPRTTGAPRSMPRG